MLKSRIVFCLFMFSFSSIYALDLASGGNLSFAQLEGFSYNDFKIKKLHVTTAKGEEKLKSVNEDFAEKIRLKVEKIIKDHSNLESKSLSSLNIELFVNIKHGKKLERMISFHNKGSARVVLTLLATDDFNREVFYISQTSSLDRSLFGGSLASVIYKSTKGFFNALNSILASNKNHLPKNLREGKSNNNLASNSSTNFAPRSGLWVTKKSNKKGTNKENIGKDSPLSLKSKVEPKKTFVPQDVINVGLGVGGYGFVGAEYKWRYNRDFGLFGGLALIGGSIGGMVYLKEEKFSNYINLGIDTYFIQDFIGLKIQYGDYLFKNDNGAFSYEVGLYKVINDKSLTENSEKQEDDFGLAASIGYAF